MIVDLKSALEGSNLLIVPVRMLIFHKDSILEDPILLIVITGCIFMFFVALWGMIEGMAGHPEWRLHVKLCVFESVYVCVSSTSNVSQIPELKC